jgi:hypothetical protein
MIANIIPMTAGTALLTMFLAVLPLAMRLGLLEPR